MPEESTPESMEHLLWEISRLRHRRAHAIWDEIGLYHGQPRILEALWEQEGLTHSELAEQAHVRPATVTKMIQRMERAGFLKRKADAEDQRISRVFLTETGRRVQDDVEGAWKRLEEETFAGFTVEERVLLRRFFVQIRDNLIKITEAGGHHRHDK
jgi:DNA-binding MarR family transcriptional regulator